MVQHHCVKLDPPVSLTSLAEWRVSICLFARCARSYMSLSRHSHTLLPFTCADDSCLLHVVATHGCEFCDRFVGAFQESPPARPSVKASLSSLPAARLLLNAVYLTTHHETQCDFDGPSHTFSRQWCKAIASLKRTLTGPSSLKVQRMTHGE